MFIKGAKLAFGLEPSVVGPTDETVLKRIIKKYAPDKSRAAEQSIEE